MRRLDPPPGTLLVHRAKSVTERRAERIFPVEEAMATAAPEFPVIEDQTAFNLQHWEEVCADPSLAGVPGRIETDALGQIIMTAPPAPEHGEGQFFLGNLLASHLPSDGGHHRMPNFHLRGSQARGCGVDFPGAAGIPVGTQGLHPGSGNLCGMLSPNNTRAEIDGKKRLYFAGASEVWVCGLDGSLRFFRSEAPEELGVSAWCPEFPPRID